MEMHFEFLNGSKTTIFLESMRFCLFVEKKIQMQALAFWKQRAQPESTASLSHKCSSSREVKQDSLDLVLKKRMVCSPVTEQHICLARNSKQLASGKCLLSRTAKHLWTNCVGQTCLQPDRLQIQVHSCRTVTGQSIFISSHLASEGSLRLFPSVCKAQSLFLQEERA